MATAEHTLQEQIRPPAEEITRSIGNDVSRRVLRFVGVFRAAVTLAMLVIALGFRDPPILGVRDPAVFLSTASLYCLFALALLAWQWHRPVILPRVALAELAADIFAVTVLMNASGGITSGIGGLLVVFVGAASLTLRGRQAFLASAVAALAVLAQQALNVLDQTAPSGDFIAAGVLGGIIFMIASAAYPLARRLEESEALARQRGIDLANLAQLNEYVIQNLRESIVVVDEANRVRLINQSAAEHTGIRTREPGQDLARLAPHLNRMLSDWRRQGNPLLQPPSFLSADGSTRINAYLAPLGGREDGPVLMFLEDAGLLAQKVQQTKLAALGRLSASIAHEIRNPVGALSHASQLLEESRTLGPDDRRLIDIIQTNSKRVSEIVESVLQLSRREDSRPELIYLAGWTREFAAEFSSTCELYEGQVLVAAAEDVEVRMDPGHLRQIVWNLCENAMKYGSGNGGIAIEIACGRLPGNRRPFLEVADSGPGIPVELGEQIFEPFATGRNGGTGLGLFISRELCECNRAALIYEPRRTGGSVFRIVFADPRPLGKLSMARPVVLVVDDEPDIRELVAITLERMDIEASTCADITSARDRLARREFQLCLTDMRLPDGDGIELIEWMQARGIKTPVAVITAHGNVETAVRALKVGAFDFISKPVDIKVLRKLVGSALKVPRADVTGGKAQLLGASPAIDRLRQTIGKVARSQAPVHITGESGTGKELVARMIHEQGSRADGPFVPVNCGAIPGELMESEFFGHRKGSFTGAVSDKTGLFQSAEGGTLFMDEIADLPLPMQVKLLRVIQEKTLRPVGQAAEVPVDVRILSATHKDLRALVASGQFREDLYYRINVIELRVPPLRDRGDDVLLLTSHILGRLAGNLGLPAPDLTPEARAKLAGYRFPGNVRELENILERAIALCGEQVTAEDIQIHEAQPAAEPAMTATGALLGDRLESVERETIRSALQEHRYNKTATARKLGLTLRALRYRMQKLGMD